MSLDINIIQATVVAIQNNPISSVAPLDGYVLMWDASDGYWKPRSLPTPTGLRVDTFTSSGTWTCPAGVTSILLIGAGGGGGGAGGPSINSIGGGAGAGAIQQTVYSSVTPSTAYTVTIGAGGVGSSGKLNGDSGSPLIGGDGYSTIVSAGGTNYFFALGAAGAGGTSPDSFWAVGGSFPNTAVWYTGGAAPLPALAGFGGSGIGDFKNGNKNYIGGFAGGTVGADAGGYPGSGGGGGGGAGPRGVGGNGGAGGNGINGPNAANGVSGGANTGAGGGGGGTGAGTGNGGNGADGGSGYLYILY